MARETIALPAVDELRLTIVMDNTIDVLMTDTEVAKRVRLGPFPFERLRPFAEHGVSMLLSVRHGQRQGSVLFDTGASREGILHNLDALEIQPNQVNAVVLSHGHADHSIGLTALLDRFGERRLPVVLHPEAYLERKLIFPDGRESNVPPPKKADLRRENIEVIEEVGPSFLVEQMVLVSGEIARTSDFETGFPIHHAKREGVWQPDPLILDDQCVIVNVRDRGLVVATGCGHAGIINTIRNAQAITGIDKVYAVIGGFHLTGGIFEQRIPATVEALKEIGPRYLVPGHCTGWSATHQIAAAMPEAFVPNSVGTTYVFA